MRTQFNQLQTGQFLGKQAFLGKPCKPTEKFSLLFSLGAEVVLGYLFVFGGKYILQFAMHKLQQIHSFKFHFLLDMYLSCPDLGARTFVCGGSGHVCVDLSFASVEDHKGLIGNSLQ